MISVWFAIFCNLTCCGIVFVGTMLYYKSIIFQMQAYISSANQALLDVCKAKEKEQVRHKKDYDDVTAIFGDAIVKLENAIIEKDEEIARLRQQLTCTSNN